MSGNKSNIQVSKKTTIAFFVLCICYMVPNFAQYLVSPLGSVVMERYNMELPQLSSLFSAPMIPAIFFSLIGGLLIDKFGPKMVIGAGMILTTLGCIWRLFCGSFSPLMFATLLTGFSACFITAGSGKIVANLYGPENVQPKMGLLMAFSTAAMTIANFSGARFGSLNTAFSVSAIFAVVSTVLWVVFEKDPKTQNTESAAENVDFPPMSECLKVSLQSKNVWIVAFALFFIMSANVVVASFIPTALASKGIEPIAAGNLAAMITVGNFLGCLIAPLCINKLHSQKKTLIVFAVLSAIGVAFAWLLPNTWIMGIAFLLTGMFLGGMIPTLMGLPVQFKKIGPLYAGTAGGVIGTVQILGAVIVPSYILTPIAGSNFKTLFILGGVCMLIAGILSACVKEID